MSIEELYPGTGEDDTLIPDIDIVAIHGLNPWNKEDHAILTWQDKKSGHLWLQQSLPKSQPNARVLLYSYESSPVFGASRERFIYQANSLLECLRLIRIKDPDRPLIMMGHSLGGILIKQALVNAQSNSKFKALKLATFGIIFFGTPHAGPSEDLKVMFGKACVAIAQSIPGSVSNDTMEALTSGSLFTDTLEEHWRHQLEDYQFVSFYEGIHPIVPRKSAVLGLKGERESQVQLNATHSNMCRFNPDVKEDAKNYFYVQGHIADLCNSCPVPNINDTMCKAFRAGLENLASNPRLETVAERFQNSFQWIWHDSPDGPGFSDWLRSDAPIYWVTGLPGSGKSTLMKYVCRETIGRYLHKDSPKVMRYFFHLLGQSQEQTFRSFLASFLAQLIDEFNGLARRVIPLFRRSVKSSSRRKKPKKVTFTYDEAALKKALSLAMTQDVINRNVILFLDGLDECSGDNRAQVEFLQGLVDQSATSRFPLRICLASRAVPEIEPKLSHCPRCKIHEWTAPDIADYVQTKLSETRARWGDQVPEDDDIIDEVVEKAGGVFLWVEVVVKNLISGLEDGNTADELKAQLRSFPSELEPLYARILQQIPNEYIHDTINYIGILRSYDSGNISLLQFELAARNGEEALKRDVHDIMEFGKRIGSQCNLLRRRITSRCRGLIYVRNIKGEEKPPLPALTSHLGRVTSGLEDASREIVQFLHLTTMEYLTQEHVRISMIAKTSSLDLIKPGSVQIQASFLSLLKMLKLPDPNGVCRIENSDVDHILLMFYFEYARRAEAETGSSQRLLMTEVDRICTQGGHSWYLEFHQYMWPRSADMKHLGTYPPPERGLWNIDFLCICLCMRLIIFVREEVELFGYKPCERQGRPILDFLFDRDSSLATEGYDSLTELLLRHGAQPNQVFKGRTSWSYALDRTFQGNPYWFRSLALVHMLDFGADPNQKFLELPSSPLTQAIYGVNKSPHDLESEDGMRLIGRLISYGADIQLETRPLDQRLVAFIEKKAAERVASRYTDVSTRTLKRKNTLPTRQSKRLTRLD